MKRRNVAVIATDGFEESELKDPVAALEESGAKTTIISTKPGTIKGWKNGQWTSSIDVQETFVDADARNFDALLIPGGTLNADKLRTDKEAVKFVKEFFSANKPVAAICHGPQILIDADVLKNRRMTSYHSIKTDLINAGAEWMDAAVVVDDGFVTSRTPDDLPEFISKMLEEIEEGRHI